jgi:hypothetical protein
MAYGRVHLASRFRNGKGAAVSHLAELVRGDFLAQGPLIRSFEPPSPIVPEARLRRDGEKGNQGRVHVAGLMQVRLGAGALFVDQAAGGETVEAIGGGRGMRRIPGDQVGKAQP